MGYPIVFWRANELTAISWWSEIWWKLRHCFNHILGLEVPQRQGEPVESSAWYLDSVEDFPLSWQKGFWGRGRNSRSLFVVLHRTCHLVPSSCLLFRPITVDLDVRQLASTYRAHPPDQCISTGFVEHSTPRASIVCQTTYRVASRGPIGRLWSEWERSRGLRSRHTKRWQWIFDIILQWADPCMWISHQHRSQYSRDPDTGFFCLGTMAGRGTQGLFLLPRREI